MWFQSWTLMGNPIFLIGKKKPNYEKNSYRRAYSYMVHLCNILKKEVSRINLLNYIPDHCVMIPCKHRQRGSIEDEIRNIKSFTLLIDRRSSLSYSLCWWSNCSRERILHFQSLFLSSFFHLGDYSFFFEVSKAMERFRHLSYCTDAIGTTGFVPAAQVRSDCALPRTIVIESGMKDFI